jgi:hypothetical protein
VHVGFWDFGEVAFFASGASPVPDRIVAVLPPFQMLRVNAPAITIPAKEVTRNCAWKWRLSMNQPAHFAVRIDCFPGNAEDAIAFVVARIRED